MEQPNLLFYKKISIYAEYVRIEHEHGDCLDSGK